MESHRIVLQFVAGKERARSTRGGIHYTPKRTANMLKEIRGAWMSEVGVTAGINVPVMVRIETRRAMPKSRTRKDRRCEDDVFKPDIDNIVKLVLDGLNGAAWADDKQVVEVVARKLPREYGISDSTTVTVEWESDGIQESGK